MWRSVTEACRGLALAVWLVSLCSVRAPCLDFAAEKEEWYTAFVSVTYVDPVTAELRTEKSECGHYGEHSPKRDAKGLLATAASARERYACDPNTRFAVPDRASAWIALVTRGNCTFRDKIRHASGQNASAVVIFNVGASNANETITMPHSGNSQTSRSTCSALKQQQDAPVYSQREQTAGRSSLTPHLNLCVLSIRERERDRSVYF